MAFGAHLDLMNGPIEFGDARGKVPGTWLKSSQRIKIHPATCGALPRSGQRLAPFRAGVMRAEFNNLFDSPPDTETRDSEPNHNMMRISPLSDS